MVQSESLALLKQRSSYGGRFLLTHVQIALAQAAGAGAQRLPHSAPTQNLGHPQAQPPPLLVLSGPQQHYQGLQTSRAINSARLGGSAAPEKLHTDTQCFLTQPRHLRDSMFTFGEP